MTSQIIFHSYQRYDGKSDIWSLGCVLYEICAQRKTFDGDNPLAIVRKIMAVQYEPLSKKLPYTNKARQLIKDMLQKDPRKRPSADELDKELIPNWQNMLNLSSAHFDSGETQASDSLRSNVYYYSTGTKRKQFYINNDFLSCKLFSANNNLK